MVPPPHSAAVETSTLEGPLVAHLPAAVRADRLWVRRNVSRAWRYALLRRMLACADIAAAFLWCSALGMASGGTVGQLAWSLGLLPVWVVIAKLLGLYDRDERPLRHTTIDEAESLVLWGVSGTFALVLLLQLTPAGRPEASTAVVAGVVATVAVFSLRALVRFLWRAATPPERVAIIGSTATRGAVKRKLELFRDLHMTVVEEHESTEIDGRTASRLLGTVDRLVYAPASLDTEHVRTILDLSRADGGLLTVVLPCRDTFMPAVRLSHLAELPILEYKRRDSLLGDDLLQARDRRRRQRHDARRAVAAARCHRSRDQTRRPWAGCLLSSASRGRRTPIPHAQVPLDGRRRRGAPREPRFVRRSRGAHVQVARRSARHAARPRPAALEPRRASSVVERSRWAR